MKKTTKHTALKVLLPFVTICAGTPSYCQTDLTISDVTEMGDFLTHEATCGDFNDALSRHGKASQTDRDQLLVYMALTYVEGHVTGSGQGRKGRAPFLVACMIDPSRKFHLGD